MGKILTLIKVAAVCSCGALAVACGSDSASSESTGTEGSGEAPQIVVTTNILGDIVSQVVGDLADVEVVMPIGADPHDFAPSAKQAESMEDADLLVVNGAGFEEGMLDIIDTVEESGTEVFVFADQIELLGFTGEHSDEEGEEGAGEHSDEEGEEHSDGGVDPHIWTDPTRMITAVEALEPVLAGVAGIDADVLAEQADAYLAELTTLDREMEDTLVSIPEDQRVLVTNHEVFGYFADRFGFEVVGAIIPSLSTNADASAGEVEELAELVEAAGIPAIFGETTQSTQLADVLAEAVGNDVDVVVLFSESLGEPGSGAETYLDMMKTNSIRISDALTP